MFGVLLESRARRQRRTGGAALSVAAHVALIGLATAATVQGSPREKKRPEARFIVFTPPPVPKRVTARVQESARRSDSRPALPPVVVVDIVAPSIAPPSLPRIDTGADPLPDVFTIRSGGNGPVGGGHRGIVDGSEPAPNATDWRANEILIHVLSFGKPRYPEPLRQSGINGTVLVQFTVDTLGRI